MSNDRKKLQKCKAVVGTPGRIVHLIKNNVLNTSKIRVIVLDEIDKLLTETFSKDIDFIFKSLPKKHQVIGSSATYDKEVEKGMKKYMKNPIGVTPKREAPVLLGVKQFVYDLEGENLTQMKEMSQKVKVIASILSTVSFKQCLVFSCSQQRAESYSNYLSNEGWPCEVIMGSQEQITRLDIFKKFKEFKCRILVATDLMARGIDSENVNLVINLEVPNESSLYLHRIGRCGRFGSHGIAVTLVHNNDELIKFRKLLGSIGGSEMRVLNFPKKDPSNIWNFGDRDADLKLYGEISGITTKEMTKIVKIRENEHENPIEKPDTVRKNLDLLEISKLLVDNPENGNILPEEDLFESYSMVVNGSYVSELDDVPLASSNNNVDVNRQFIDAISRLNLYPEESMPNLQPESNSSKNVNESRNNHNGDLNSNTDGSNVGSKNASELDSYSSDSDTDKSDECSCSYRQSESEEDGYELGYNPSDRYTTNSIGVENHSLNNNQQIWKSELERKWNSQFMYQISLIQNYVNNIRYVNGQYRGHLNE